MTTPDYQRAHRLLDLDPSVGQYACEFRWELVNKNLEQLGWLHPQRDQAAALSNNTRARIFRSITGVSLRERDWRELNPLSDHVRPWMVLEDGTMWPMGLFLIDDDHEHPHSQESSLELDLNDFTSELDDPLPYSVSIAPGGELRETLVRLAQEAGITRFRVADFTRSVGQAVNWPAGTSRLDVIRKLCELGGMLPAYFDNEGYLVVRPSPQLEIGAARLKYDQRIIPDRTTVNRGLGKAPNAFMVIGTGGGAVPVVAVAYVDPSLPHSRENRGRTITNVDHEQGIGDYQSAATLAQQRAQADPRQYATATFSSVIDPRHDTFDVLGFSAEPWLEVGWRTALSAGGEHSHDVVKTITTLENFG